MSRLILWFLCSCVLGSSAFAQASSARELPDAQIADLIARVKDVQASKLERGLPAIRFEDWVQARAGADAKSVSWTFRRGPASAMNNMGFPDCVDVHAMTKDGRSFFLSIGVSTDADQIMLFWLGGAVNLQHKSISLDHLSQLPRLLLTASQNSHPSEVQK
jgi:hypothetical protein